LGWKITLIVIAFNVAIILLGRSRDHEAWIGLWLFLAPLSIFQVFPDWFLVEQLGTLLFPDTGGPFVGPVPVFMAGMWTIPLFFILHIGLRTSQQLDRRSAYWFVGIFSAILFLGSEALLWKLPIWEAVNVLTIAHVGLYLVVPEILLGLTAFWMYDAIRHRGVGSRIAGAFLVSMTYLGSLGFFYILIEQILT
jgi:hypothetical protein